MTQRTRFAGALLVMTIITILASFFISYFLVGGQFFPQLAVVPTPTPIPTPTPTPSPTPTPIPSPTPSPFPTSIPTTLPTPSPTPTPFISSSAAYLIDADTNRVLYDVNSLEQLPIASITKIMTAIVAIEKGNLEQGLTVQQSDLDQVPEGASNAGLVAKDYFRLRTLLYGLMLRSGTDAAIVIARVVSGSTENFVSMMNNKAQALGLTNTRFSTPHGFSSNNNYSCARDLVALANYAMRNPLFAQITSQTAYDVQPTLYTHAYHWENTNALLSSYEGADGVKTGWTEEAGVCLIFSARRNGQHLIGVVLHSSTYETVFEDGAKLLDLGFSKSE